MENSYPIMKRFLPHRPPRASYNNVDEIKAVDDSKRPPTLFPMNAPFVTDRPPAEGWYWWRKDEYEPWSPVEVHEDQGELYSRGNESGNYQCASGHETPFRGQWWSARLVPPADKRPGDD